MADATISASSSAGATLTNAAGSNGVPLQDPSRVTVQTSNAVVTGSGDFYNVTFGSGADSLVATNMIWVRPPSGASIGFDSINMGAGDDYLHFDRSAAAQTISMGDGADTLRFDNSGARGVSMGAGNDLTDVRSLTRLSDQELSQKSGAPVPSYDGGTGIDTLQLAGDWSITLSSGSFVLDTNNDGTGDTTVNSLSSSNFGQVVGMPALLNGTVNWGTQTLSNGTTVNNSATFSNYEMLQAICFTAGSLIDTPDGVVPIESLRPGDLVTTRSGPRPVIWIGCRKLDVVDLMANPKLLPVKVPAGALGDGRPNRDVMFSPQHRILIKSAIARKMFDTAEVLIPVKHMVGLNGIEVVGETRQVSYYHIMLESHEIVSVDGIEAETLLPGKQALTSLSPGAREELFALFPNIQTDDPVALVSHNVPILKGRDARALVARHVRHPQLPLRSPGTIRRDRTTLRTKRAAVGM